MTLKPCKHLDYDMAKYGDSCELQTCAPHFPDVRYWLRDEETCKALDLPGCPPVPRRVQFCGLGRGRINGIFQCYDGEMPCYDPSED